MFENQFSEADNGKSGSKNSWTPLEWCFVTALSQQLLVIRTDVMRTDLKSGDKARHSKGSYKGL